MDDFLSLGGIYDLFLLNKFWRLGSIIEILKVKKVFEEIISLRYILPKVRYFQVLLISERIHPNQVFQHQKVDQILLY